MARPTKAPQERRSEQVNIGLSPVELARVRDRAGKVKTTVTDFMRQAALDKPLRVEETQAVDFKTRHELRRIGNNLNQIAHALHTGQGYAPQELTALCEKLDTLFDRWLGHDPAHSKIRNEL